jgi:hypothetical protein
LNHSCPISSNLQTKGENNKKNFNHEEGEKNFSHFVALEAHKHCFFGEDCNEKNQQQGKMEMKIVGKEEYLLKTKKTLLSMAGLAELSIKISIPMCLRR